MTLHALKCIIFLTYAAMVLAKPLTTKERHEIGRQCQKQIGIESKVIEDAVTKQIIPNTPKYKNFLFCSYKKQGYQDINGKFIPENLKEFLSPMYKEKTNRIVDNCMNIVAKEPTEISFLTLECLLNEMREAEAENKV